MYRRYSIISISIALSDSLTHKKSTRPAFNNGIANAVIELLTYRIVILLDNLSTLREVWYDMVWYSSLVAVDIIGF